MKLYVSDYIGDTKHLTIEQHGAYLMLLMVMWNAGGRLQNDEKYLSRVVGVSVKKWRSIGSEVLEFFEAEGGYIFNHRLLEEVKKAEGKSDLCASAGERGGKAKALKIKDVLLADATKKTSHTFIEPEPEPKERKELPLVVPKKEKNGTRIPDDFEPDREWSRQQGLSNSELRIEFEKFKNYWMAKSGKDATKKDWQATWRNWIINAVERRGRNSGPTTIAGAAAQAIEENRNDQFSFDAMERQQGQPDGRIEPGRSHVSLALPKLPK